MVCHRQIEDLIEIGRRFVEDELDEHEFRRWGEEAFHCLEALWGADHTYTKCFRGFTRWARNPNVLVGIGILCAARQGSAANPSRPPLGTREARVELERDPL